MALGLKLVIALIIYVAYREYSTTHKRGSFQKEPPVGFREQGNIRKTKY